MKILHMRQAKVSLLVIVATAVLACGSSAAEDRSSGKMRLKKKNLGGIQPLHALGDIYLAGQPSPRDLLVLQAKGIKTIISLRHTKEVPWDEAGAVQRAGMKFVHVPFSGAEQLKPATFDKVLKILRDKRSGPTVLHCASSNRVGAIWYVYRVLDGKLSPDAAMKEAQTVGLRTQAYLVPAKEYVEAAQKKEATSEK